MADVNPPHRQSAVVGSPRSRGSIQHAATPTYQAPAVPGEEYVPPPGAALHVQDGDAFNVDPTTPYLDSAGPAHAPLSARSGGSNRFVGGFVGSIKKAMRKSGSDHQQPGRAPPPPPLLASHNGSVHPEPTIAANGSPRARSTHTAQDTDTLGNDDEATAVEHEVLPVAMVMGSPVYVEPQPASDYAKMDTPRQSISSFASYLGRVQKFFRDINELPWVAERVTVDYVPGERKGRRQVRVSRVQRPTSWYPENTPHRRELFSDSTSPTSLRAHEVPSPVPYYIPPPPPEHQEHRFETLQPAPPRVDRGGMNSSTDVDVIFHIDGPNDPAMTDIPLARIVPYSWQNVPEHPTPVPPISPKIPSPVVPPLNAPPSESPDTEHSRPVLTQSTPSASLNKSPSRPNEIYTSPGSSKHNAASAPQTAVPFRPFGEQFVNGYVPYNDQERTTAQYSGMAVHIRTHAAAAAATAHPPSPTASHRRSESSHTAPAIRPPSRTASKASARLSAAASPRGWENPEFIFTTDQDWPAGAATPHIAHTTIDSSQSTSVSRASPEMSQPPRTTATPHPNIAVFGARSPQIHPGSAVPSPLNPRPSPIPSLYANRPPSATGTPHVPASMQYSYPVQT